MKMVRLAESPGDATHSGPDQFPETLGRSQSKLGALIEFVLRLVPGNALGHGGLGH